MDKMAYFIITPKKNKVMYMVQIQLDGRDTATKRMLVN